MTTTSADPAVALPVDVPDAPKQSILRDVRPELRSLARYRRVFVEPGEVIPAEAAKHARRPMQAAV